MFRRTTHARQSFERQNGRLAGRTGHIVAAFGQTPLLSTHTRQPGQRTYLHSEPDLCHSASKRDVLCCVRQRTANVAAVSAARRVEKRERSEQMSGDGFYHEWPWGCENNPLCKVSPFAWAGVGMGLCMSLSVLGASWCVQRSLAAAPKHIHTHTHTRVFFQTHTYRTDTHPHTRTRTLRKTRLHVCDSAHTPRARGRFGKRKRAEIV